MSIENIASPKVTIGFAVALLLVIINTIIADRGINIIAENNQSIAKIHQVGNRIAATQPQVPDRSQLTKLQAESKQSLDGTKVAVGISGLSGLLLLVFLYGLVHWDLTKKQQAEATLRKSVAEFEELYHTAPCGYHSLDALGQFVRINQTELQMLGYEAAEIIGCKNIVDLCTPASVHIFNDNFPTIESQGWIHDLEFEMIRKDGRIVPVSATVVASYDLEGQYSGSRSTITDISDRVRSRKQARLSAEISQKIRQSLQLDQILQTAVEEVQKLLAVDRVLIFRFEPDGSGQVVQEKVLMGYPAVMGSQIVDPCFDRTYHDRYQQGRIYSVADITQAGFAPCYVEFLQSFEVKASSIVPIQLRDTLWGLLIVHHCQSPRGWQPKELEIMSQLATQIGIALAQAQLLEQEQLQRIELSRSNAELEQFAHIASHDLQEPLRMVISYLQLLERRYQGQLDPAGTEFIDYAVDGAMRMQTLIQDLLSYARVSSRKQPFEAIDCNLVFQDAISNLHVAISESGAIVSHDPLPVVWGDATQLTQVFQNLIANAIKFRQVAIPQIHVSVQPLAALPSGATAQIDRSRMSTKQPDSAQLSIDSTPTTAAATIAPPAAWCFAVADNGIGIEAQYLDRIFAIFQRLHTRITYPGTGIGLAICKKIVERHSGTIWVKSKSTNLDSVPHSLPASPESNGSVFYFTIPAVGSTSHNYAKQPHH